MASCRKPTHKPVTRMPSSSPSFASCFGATAPVSPPQASGQALLAGQAGVSYRRLGPDDFEVDEGSSGYVAAAREQMCYNQHFGGGAIMKVGKQSSIKERSCRRSEIVYVSEGEQDQLGRRGSRMKGGLKLGKQRDKAEVMDVSVTMGQLRVRKGSNKEQAITPGEAPGRAAESPRRASFGTRMREVCVQMLETARRGSPHLSELFVGNQLLMQVTASSRVNSRYARRTAMAPSCSFHVFSNEPVNMVASPARSSTASASAL
ncbi:hypothetical protein L7F22_025930 [Adiantum nelumboides]|nr:hypothetical protein [Adiantum nelumboides]